MLLKFALLLTLAAPPKDPVAVALESYGSVTSYRVTLRSGEGDTAERIRYFYKRPGHVRMEFIRPHKGALLVYDPAAKTVKLRPFGFARPFVLTLSPDNSLVKSARGHRVDASDVGALLQRVKLLQQQGKTAILGEERVGEKTTILVSVEGEGEASLEGVHRYLLWLDKTTWLPLKTKAFGRGGEPLEEVLMDDLELNVPLDDSLFTL